MRSIQRSFADTSSTVGAVGTVGLVEVQLDIIGNVVGVRNTTLEQGGLLLQIVEVLAQSKANALCKTAVAVAFNKQSVQDGTDVEDSSELLNLDLTGLSVNTNFRQEAAQ